MTTSDTQFVKDKLHGLASQVYILAMGLQNAAPPGAPAKSVQYLLETAAQLEQASNAIDQLLQNDYSTYKP